TLVHRDSVCSFARLQTRPAESVLGTRLHALRLRQTSTLTKFRCQRQHGLC
ncbi:hypothetical protein JOQ06_015896, partial [Pogonophryne albipinna]